MELYEVGGSGKGLADGPADDAHGDGDEERDAPCKGTEATGVNGCLREPWGHGKRHKRTGEQCCEGGDLGVRGDDAALALRSVLREEGHGAGSLAAHREALKKTQEDQQNRSRNANGSEWRQEPDAGGGNTEQGK